ncbi:hypothetical protein J3R83DRAFT_13711 [Lanmaoa asiatica]|nr:hypothetical protein J3R83DRAFT_13711 [Lanmaoa asiatica]
MGRELLAAANANPVSVPPLLSSLATPSPNTTMAPRVTIRLTRLDPSLKDEPRIERTIQCLRDMDIDVQLGERPHPHSAPMPKVPAQPKLLEPTTNINLDLSALIALISDISHSPLPRTEQEAHARFEPPQIYLDWKKDRAKSLARQSQCTDHSLDYLDDDEDDEGTWENSGQHSRALAAQAIQEMSKGILEEIHERMSTVATQPSMSVTFWTTSEARHRCLQIVSKISGERERQRADALLGSTFCSRTPPVPAPVHICPNGIAETAEKLDDVERKVSADAYWEHSRYPSGFLPLVPVHVYPSILPAMEDEDRESRTTFFNALAQTCTRILSRVSAPSDPLSTAEEVLEEISPTTQTSLPKLTVHTVTSMLAGVSRGYTTLTTNRSSVRAVLKEMRRICGRCGYESEMGDVEKAALWVVDPRSLSEGMRSL